MESDEQLKLPVLDLRTGQKNQISCETIYWFYDIAQQNLIENTGKNHVLRDCNHLPSEALETFYDFHSIFFVCILKKTNPLPPTAKLTPSLEKDACHAQPITSLQFFYLKFCDLCVCQSFMSSMTSFVILVRVT